MKKESIIWILAIVITLASAFYQRISGPTYPVSVKKEIFGMDLKANLPRSGYTSTPQKVELDVTHYDSSASFMLLYRIYKYEKGWHERPMKFKKATSTVAGYMPDQPPAGKLEYAIRISSGDNSTFLTQETIVIRFKGEVPVGFLATHVFFMFFAFLFSNYVGLRAAMSSRLPQKSLVATIVLFFLGGLFFGPIVQEYAFGQFWTGFPLGFDLTDNKVLISFVFWSLAFFRKSSPHGKWWIITASLVTLIIFLIPHSMMGSELDYNSMEIIQS